MTGKPEIGQRRGIASVAALFALLLLCAQAPASRALIVVSSESAAYLEAVEACTDRLRSGGWDIDEARSPQAGVSRASSGSYDAVIAIGAGAAHALSAAGQPNLVYCLTPEPGRMGLTTSPGVSGIGAEPDLSSRLEFVRAVVPATRTIGVLHRAGSARSRSRLDALESALPSGWNLVRSDLDAKNSAAEAIDELLSKRVDLVWMLPDPAVYDKAVVKALLLNALRAKIPVVGFSTQLAKSGTLIGFGIDPAASGERAADLVLNGVRNRHISPAPMKAINYIVAEQLGISVPNAARRDAEISFGD